MEIDPQLAAMAKEAREKKGAVRVKDPIQAMKMQQAMKQSINQMTGTGQDLSQYPPEVRREILRQRLRQKQYLNNIGRSNMTMREAAAEQMEERMKNTFSMMQQQPVAQPVAQPEEQEEDGEELTPEEKEKRRIRNLKKRLRKKNASKEHEEKTITS